MPIVKIKRKIKQITGVGYNVIALCSDGTMWERSICDSSWKRMENDNIPDEEYNQEGSCRDVLLGGGVE